MDDDPARILERNHTTRRHIGQGGDIWCRECLVKWPCTPVLVAARIRELERLTALADALADAARAITTDPLIDGPNAGPNEKWDALEAAIDAWTAVSDGTPEDVA